MKTLLECAFTKCKFVSINYQTQIEQDIYEKVVELARIKIKKALRKQQGKLILKTIYLVKNFGVYEAVGKIIGNFSEYRGSLWRISLLHAVISFISSDTRDKRIKDLIDTADKYLPFDNPIREKVIEKYLSYEEDLNKTPLSIFGYIDVYYTFGHFLMP